MTKDVFEKYIKDIPYGKENAVSRKDLVRLWNMSDRQVRDTIRSLRNHLSIFIEDLDFMIVGLNTERGYYRSTDKEVLMHFKNDRLKRAASILEPVAVTTKVIERYEKAING